MTDVLDRIRAYKLDEIAAGKQARPLPVVEEAARRAEAPRGFADALRRKNELGQHALIAEIKKASPSKGLIREEFDPPALAKAYAEGGAACLSVLTDGPSFQGAPDYLAAARDQVTLPVLRKDFLFDAWQVVEARAMGADAILIILAAVSDDQALELEDAAIAWGMDALVEVHDEAEMERAHQLSSRLIGINNRDLRTFETRLETTERIAPLAPADTLLVSESGLHQAADLARMAGAGAKAFLIGESLMRHADVASATRAILS